MCVCARKIIECEIGEGFGTERGTTGLFAQTQLVEKRLDKLGTCVWNMWTWRRHSKQCPEK